MNRNPHLCDSPPNFEAHLTKALLKSLCFFEFPKKGKGSFNLFFNIMKAPTTIASQYNLYLETLLGTIFLDLLIGHSFVRLYHTPHKTDVIFNRCSQRSSLTHIVGEISTTTPKPVVNSVTRRGIIVKGQS